MQVVIRHRGLTLTKAQRAAIRAQLDALARFGERIGQVVVRLSKVADPVGFTRCCLEVDVDTEVVHAEHSDATIALALEHAATRVARSVGRLIETRALAR